MHLFLNQMQQNKIIKDHPAFPVTPHSGDAVNKPVRGNSGMSMLDFFAGVASVGLSQSELPARQVAEEAYDIAEEMMQERQTRYSNK
jgi:hypothetical protein